MATCMLNISHIKSKKDWPCSPVSRLHMFPDPSSHEPLDHEVYGCCLPVEGRGVYYRCGIQSSTRRRCPS